MIVTSLFTDTQEIFHFSLSSMVATNHMWRFNFKLIKVEQNLKMLSLNCTSHILSVQSSYVASGYQGIIEFGHHCVNSTRRAVTGTVETAVRGTVETG